MFDLGFVCVFFLLFFFKIQLQELVSERVYDPSDDCSSIRRDATRPRIQGFWVPLGDKVLVLYVSISNFCLLFSVCLFVYYFTDFPEGWMIGENGCHGNRKT